MNRAQATGQSEEHITWLSPQLGIHNEMVTAWQNMVQHAEKSGIDLAIASGYRSFERQLTIWNRKFNGELAVKDRSNNIIDLQYFNETDKVIAILTYSALPGTSRHHWGTDIDVYATNMLPQGKTLQLEPWEYQGQGYFFKLSEWLSKNAHSFGFFLPYSHDQGGVAEEPWHLSYQPVAQQYQKLLTLPVLEKVIASCEIAGKQSILANLATIYAQYITNISDFTKVSNKEHHG